MKALTAPHQCAALFRAAAFCLAFVLTACAQPASSTVDLLLLQDAGQLPGPEGPVGDQMPNQADQDAAPLPCSALELEQDLECTDQVDSAGLTLHLNLDAMQYLSVWLTTLSLSGLTVTASYGDSEALAVQVELDQTSPARLALFNGSSTPTTVRLQLGLATPASGEAAFALELTVDNFSTRSPCTSECKEFIQLPAPGPTDGYQLVSPVRYQYGRREMVQALHFAVRTMMDWRPDTRPVGIADLSQQDGQIPGTDSQQPRHPEPSHQNGFSADVAYYLISGDNLGDQPACPTSDRRFCEGPHTLDLERTARIMIALAHEPRISQVLVDPVMQQDLRREIERLRDTEEVDLSAAARLLLRLSSGVPYHADHFHIAFFRECNDGLDNDGDQLVDIEDPQCSGWLDDSE